MVGLSFLCLFFRTQSEGVSGWSINEADEEGAEENTEEGKMKGEEEEAAAPPRVVANPQGTMSTITVLVETQTTFIPAPLLTVSMALLRITQRIPQGQVVVGVLVGGETTSENGAGVVIPVAGESGRGGREAREPGEEEEEEASGGKEEEAIEEGQTEGARREKSEEDLPSTERSIAMERIEDGGEEEEER